MRPALPKPTMFAHNIKEWISLYNSALLGHVFFTPKVFCMRYHLVNAMRWTVLITVVST